MPIDLEPYKGVLPYASELYGIYQPLLGWRSSRTQKRIEAGFNSFKNSFVAHLPLMLAPDVEIHPETLHPREVRFRVGVARDGPSTPRLLRMAPQSLIARRVLSEVQREGESRPEVWQRYTSRDFWKKRCARSRTTPRSCTSPNCAALPGCAWRRRKQRNTVCCMRFWPANRSPRVSWPIWAHATAGTPRCSCSAASSNSPSTRPSEPLLQSAPPSTLGARSLLAQ